MMRLIVRVTDSNTAIHMGGPVTNAFQTIDVDCPELERIFRIASGYSNVDAEVVGAELVGDPIFGPRPESKEKG